MKKNWLALGLVSAFLLCPMTALANNTDTMVKATISYDGNGMKASANEVTLENSFEGMAPGEERTIVYKIENKSENLADFYLSADTVNSLEKMCENANGASYAFSVKIGASMKDAITILDAKAGGYVNQEGSRQGLAEISDLNEYEYLVELDGQEVAYLFLTLSIDGEGNDNSDSSDYSNAAGEISLNFGAYDYVQRKIVEEKPSTIEYNYVKGVNTIKDVIKTGDSNNIFIFVAILLAGIVLITLFLFFNRKGKDSDSNQQKEEK